MTMVLNWVRDEDTKWTMTKAMSSWTALYGVYVAQNDGADDLVQCSTVVVENIIEL